MVPESVEIDPIHCLAQLQVGYYQRTHYFGISNYAAVVLLLRAWILGEENVGSLNERKLVTIFVRIYRKGN